MSPAILNRSGNRPYPPRRSELTARFWDALAQGRFLTTRCRACGSFSFPPRSFCPSCWNAEMEWCDLPQGGVLYSKTVVHVAPAIFAHETPYALCIVDLDVGIRVASRLVEARADLPLGARVSLVALRYEDGALFAFRPE
jgi:uncharacterized OB-fold protein